VALNKKKKRRSRSRAKVVARPPKEALARTPRERTLPINAVTVLASLLVLSIAAVLLWTAYRAVVPPGVPGLGTFASQTADSRRALSETSEELRALIDTVIDRKSDVEAASAAAGVLASEIPQSTEGFAEPVPGAGADLGVARATYRASADLLTESARLLSFAGRTPDPALSVQLGRKAGRVWEIADAAADSADGMVTAISERDSYVPAADDVADPPTPDPFVEEPPLLAVPADLNTFPIDVASSEQEDKAWVRTVDGLFAPVNAAFATMPESVATWEESGDGAGLTAAADGWYRSVVTAIQGVAAQARPTVITDVQTSVRNILWVYDEVARSFASAGTVVGSEGVLADSGRRLRLIADLWGAALEPRVTDETSLTLTLPNESGFDTTLVRPGADEESDDRSADPAGPRPPQPVPQPLPPQGGGGVPGAESEPFTVVPGGESDPFTVVPGPEQGTG
jgi:hypothetical protein